MLDLGLDVVDGVDKNNAIRFPFEWGKGHQEHRGGRQRQRGAKNVRERTRFEHMESQTFNLKSHHNTNMTNTCK